MGVFEQLVNKHQGLILLVGGIIATAVSVTVFAYTNFSTKAEVQDKIENLDSKQTAIMSRIEQRLDKIEIKQDLIIEKINQK